MAAHPRRHSILAGVNLVDTTSSSDSGDIQNLGRDLYPNIIAVVQAKGAVTGTNPTLDIYVNAKQASGDYVTLQHFTQIVATSGTTPVRVKISDVLEDTIKVVYTVGGTVTPTFNNVFIDLYFASPDA
jgi:hypothetical protein